jgi:hypothetical protein
MQRAKQLRDDVGDSDHRGWESRTATMHARQSDDSNTRTVGSRYVRRLSVNEVVAPTEAGQSHSTGRADTACNRPCIVCHIRRTPVAGACAGCGGRAGKSVLKALGSWRRLHANARGSRE